MRRHALTIAVLVLMMTRTSAQQLDPAALNKLADQVISDAAVLTKDSLALKAALAATPAPPPIPSPPPSGTVVVPAGSDFQAMLNATTASTAFRLACTGTWSSWVLPAKAAGVTITIQSDCPLPAKGTRIGPMQSAALMRIKSTDGSEPPIVFAQGAHDYLIDGCAPQPFGDGHRTFIQVGTDNETDPLRQPTNNELRHCLLVASAITGGRRGVEANSGNLTVRDSYIAGFWASQDSQAVGGWNGPGPVLIENNLLEASGENVMFGGADDTNAMMSPRNVTVRGNTLTKNLAWKGRAGITIKNALEFKNVQRALVEYNTLENVWGGQGQSGFCLVVTPRNDNNVAPWTIVADVEYHHNVARHCTAGVNVLGHEDVPKLSGRTQRINMHDNLWYDIAGGRTLLVGGGPRDVWFTHNTVLGHNLNTMVYVYGGQPMTNDGMIVRDNILNEGDYGIAGDNTGLGRPALDVYAPDAIFSRNVILRTVLTNSIPYGPQTNTIVTISPVSATTMKPTSTAWTTTDGKPVGADIDGIVTGIPGLNLSQ